MSKSAVLRVCASCEWVFRIEKGHHRSCPSCGFNATYGARYVYGDSAYIHELNQSPWREKKLSAYAAKLDLTIARNRARVTGARKGLTKALNKVEL